MENNKVEMKVQNVVDVVLIFIVPTQSLLHNNNIGVTYRRTSKFRMKLVRSIPLYFVVMCWSMITVTEVPFVSALVHIVVGIRSTPQTPRGTKLVSLHENMPIEVNKVFVS
jgi:hypothetical protein